jgi:hypothetical protein
LKKIDIIGQKDVQNGFKNRIKKGQTDSDQNHGIPNMDPECFFIYLLLFIPHPRRLRIADGTLLGSLKFESFLLLLIPYFGVMSQGPTVHIQMPLSLAPCMPIV